MICVYDVTCCCAEFIAVCAALKQDMLAIVREDHGMPQEAIDWIDQVRKAATADAHTMHQWSAHWHSLSFARAVLPQVIEYNCIGGKLNRGISVIHWYVLLRASSMGC